MGYTFDGENKLIILTAGTTSFSVQDLYSRWKDWVLLTDNSKYVHAFTSVAGDPIGAGQKIAPYIFLNTTDGWFIRPQETDHELRISGNLYSVDANLSLFVPTLGNYTVTVIIERSASAIAVTVGGIDQATVQSALTAQGYTTTRAANIDHLDVDVSSRAEPGEGLTNTQMTMLLELYKIMGLDPTKPLVVTATSKKVPASGADITQTITQVGDDVTVQRT